MPYEIVDLADAKLPPRFNGVTKPEYDAIRAALLALPVGGALKIPLCELPEKLRTPDERGVPRLNGNLWTPAVRERTGRLLRYRLVNGSAYMWTIPDPRVNGHAKGAAHDSNS